MRGRDGSQNGEEDNVEGGQCCLRRSRPQRLEQTEIQGNFIAAAICMKITISLFAKRKESCESGLKHCGLMTCVVSQDPPAPSVLHCLVNILFLVTRNSTKVTSGHVPAFLSDLIQIMIVRVSSGQNFPVIKAQ